MDFNIEVPINQVSFGQVSYQILRELYKRELNPCIFPIQLDISAFPPNEDFNKWLTDNVNKSQIYYSRNNPGFKLWHINGSVPTVSKRNTLFTFFELNKLTSTEENILKNQDKVLVSSLSAEKLFTESGINTTYCPLAFDSFAFKKLPKRAMADNVTVWGLLGKLEKRKGHYKALATWARRFGNNPKHVLHAAIFNPFLKPEDTNTILHQILEGKKYWNINFVPHTTTNESYNQVLNSIDIQLGVSFAEGFDIPTFSTLCLGKHAIVTKISPYTDYTNEEMVTYLEPNGMQDCYDGIFFKPDQPFNIGQYVDWKEEDLVNCFDIALEKYKKNPTNKLGEELLTKYTWKNTVDIILGSLK